MKITLISLSEDIAALGLRYLSAYLKRHGHDVRLIFLRGHTQKTGFVYQYSEKILEEVTALCQNSDLIGISVYTNYYDRVVQLTKWLKQQLKTPIIWGNLHATVRPEDSLKYADMVCVGEGEGALLELADKIANHEDYSEVQNIWLKINGEIKKNPHRALIQDLDSLPFADYNLDDDYVLEGEEFVQVKVDNFPDYLPKTFDKDHNLKVSFGFLGSRGCPHACTYCGNNVRKQLYEGQRYLRFRSAENIVRELKLRLKQFPYIEMFSFIDDAFTAQPLEEIEKFCQLYKEEINIPFRCFASPMTLAAEKLDLLIDAGLQHIGIGIQSGSDRMQKFYKRYNNAEKILTAGQLLKKHRVNIAPPCYDIIVDNPYEKNEDYIETLKLLIQIPKPYHLSLFSIVFYPGTEMNKIATEDGLLKDEIEEVSRKSWGLPDFSGINLIFYLISFNGNFKWLAKYFANEKRLEFINKKSRYKIWRPLFTVAKIFFLGKETIKAIFRGDIIKKIRWVFESKG